MSRRDSAALLLDELFAQVEDLEGRIDATLGRRPEPVRREPLVAAPGLDLGSALVDAANAAAEVRGADASLVRLFDDRACAMRGMSEQEAERYAVGPPPAGPNVWALAIAYEPDPSIADGRPPLTTALAAPIQLRGATIGFVSIFSRSAEAAFDESQGRRLQAIAARVRDAVGALRGVPATPSAEAGEPGGLLRTALLAIAGAACVVAPLTVLTGVHSGIRAVSALALLTLAPGAAALPLLAPRAGRVELGLVLGTSLGVCGLLAELMLWLGAWSPVSATVVVGVLSLVSIGAQLAIRSVEPRGWWGRP